MIEQLCETGMNWRSIATCLGISEQTLYRHGIKFGGGEQFHRYHDIATTWQTYIYPLTDIETDTRLYSNGAWLPEATNIWSQAT